MAIDGDQHQLGAEKYCAKVLESFRHSKAGSAFVFCGWASKHLTKNK